MKCPNCGFDSPPEMKYCGHCGTRLAQVCPSCNFANPLDYRFCGMCGARLTEEPVAEQPQQPLVAASALPTAPPVGQLEGERRVATVILADVQSSTNLIEQIGTEAWVQVMNRVLQILEAEIYRFGGRVDQFRGDGLVAFFGATSAHEDDPERAVLAALSMQQALKPYAAELADQEGIDLRLRVGVNTGEVIVTRVGDSSRYREDTAMGEAVALAARMETAAEPGTVLVSENTFQWVESKFEWQPLGEITVKGVSKPIAVYQPLNPRAGIGWAHDLQAGGILAPLTGRDAEFQTLQRCIEDLYGGRGGIVLVTGDKGMGKTFLVTQVRHHFARQEALLAQVHSGVEPLSGAASTELHHTTVAWLHGSCRSYDQSTPFSMWLDMLRNWLEMQTDEPNQDLQTRLRHQAEVLWGGQLEKYYPYLATLLSLPLDETSAQRVKHLNAEGLQKQFFQAICNWVEALARRGPLVLAFNDMQWADTSSLDLLRRCLSLCGCETVLWLAIFRPDQTSAVWDFRHHVESEYPHRLTHIDLPPLADLDSREMIDHLIGHATLPDETIALIIQKAEGNPYYIREIVHALVAQGILARDAETGAWRLARSVTSLDPPGSLQSLLLARIDRLSPEERWVLQMAAVIGPLFWWNVLQALVSDTNQLRACLTGLQRAQLIQERSQIPDLGMEYAFSSLLIRDVAYDSLLSAQRAAYHLNVAAHIEGIVGPESRKPYHSLLAYHYQRAGQPNKELYYALGAAEEARKVYANPEALGHFTRALELLDQMESDAQDENQRHSIRALRFEALSGRREVYYPMGNIEAGHADSRTLLPLAQQMADDPAWMVDALLAQPQVTDPNNREEIELGLSMAQEALALARSLGDKRREMNSLISAARCRLALQDPTWQEPAEHALELTRQLGDLRMEVNLLLGIGNVYGMDNPQRSKEYLDAALSICHRLDDKATEITLLQASSPQVERKGDYVRQLTEYEQKRLDLSREIGNRMEEGHALMFCGQIQGLYLGDYDGGLALMEEVVRLWEESPGKLFPLLRIAQIQTAQGKYHEAQATLERARATSERVVLGIGHAGLGLVSAILYNALSDEAHLRMVLELAAQVGQMVADNLASRQYQMAAACELASAHLGLARGLLDEAERQEHLSQALDSSRTALNVYNEFGFTQIVECTSEEVLYRHSLALAANGYQADANEYLTQAYEEMMRKHNLIPAASPFRQTYLENIALHREIRALYSATVSQVGG